MSQKGKKQFGVWMDSHHATVIGRNDLESGEFVVLGHIKNNGPDANSNENAANNQEVTLRAKYFKEITALMQNIDELHLSGPGIVQEQFINYLAETPQYKNVKTSESTSNKMSDEHIIEFFQSHFN